MRLNKYIALCGAASRRHADDMIAASRVTVNGNVVHAMGTQVDPEKDTVCLDGNVLSQDANEIYVMLNKPAGVLSSCADDRGRKTVVDLVGGAGGRLFPVGRLDFDTEGLLLLTNNGDFAYRCTHPKHEVPKTYNVVVKGILNEQALQTLRSGVIIDGGRTQPARIDVIEQTSRRTELRMTIYEGKNRQIKRMFQLAGCRVTFLKRTAIGKLTLGNLSVGQWRFLRPEELKLVE